MNNHEGSIFVALENWLKAEITATATATATHTGQTTMTPKALNNPQSLAGWCNKTPNQKCSSSMTHTTSPKAATTTTILSLECFDTGLLGTQRAAFILL